VAIRVSGTGRHVADALNLEKKRLRGGGIGIVGATRILAVEGHRAGWGGHSGGGEQQGPSVVIEQAAVVVALHHVHDPVVPPAHHRQEEGRAEEAIGVEGGLERGRLCGRSALHVL